MYDSFYSPFIDASQNGQISTMFFQSQIKNNICSSLRSGARFDPSGFISTKFGSERFQYPSWAGVRCKDESCSEFQVNYCCEGAKRPVAVDSEPERNNLISNSTG